MTVLDTFTQAQLNAALTGHRWISAVLYRRQIGSTNDLAKAHADAGAPEGLLVIADEQCRGRGRMGRRWWSPAGTALLTSLLFRPADLPPTHIQQLAMLCALAAADAVTTRTGIPVGLKWPNDLVIGGRKLAGLLAEAAFKGDRVGYVIVGLGLNVNTDFADAPPFIAPATSLRQELGRPVDRLALLTAYLDNVADRYARLRAGDSPHTEWAGRLETVGQPVTAHLIKEGATLSGVAERVGADGALLVRTPDGRVHRLLAADVSLRARES